MQTTNPYQSCIDACLQCAEACDHCAASCLRETDITIMVRCVQLDLECSAICRATAQLMELSSNHANAICQLCAEISQACAEECEKHDHEHCRLCATYCRSCAEECLCTTAA